MSLLVKNREIVLPGQLLAKGNLKPGENVYVDGRGFLRSSKVGLVDLSRGEVRVIPLRGVYMPKVEDIVVGVVSRVAGNTVLLDINSPYTGVLLLPRSREGRRSGRRRTFSVGDVVLAKVRAFDGASNPLLTVEGEGLGKLSGGTIIKVNPAKVPRIIGKRRSMINLLRDKIGRDIVVGRNGFVWVKVRDLQSSLLLERALRLIERESHVPGLSDRVTDLLEGGIAAELPNSDYREV